MVLKQLLTRSLLGTALLGAVSTANLPAAKAQPAFVPEFEDPPLRMEEERDPDAIDFNFQFGFGYVRSRTVSGLEKIMEDTRNSFVGMDGNDTLVSYEGEKGFREWFTLGDQNAYLTLTMDLIFKKPLLTDRDYLMLRLTLDYGGSKIFGERRIKETFEGKVMGISLGQTPTFFRQELEHFLRASIGVRYLLNAHQSPNVDFGFLVGTDIGLVYLKGNSELNIHVVGNKKTDFVGWDQLRQLEIYQDIITSDKYEEVGLLFRPELGVRARLWGATLDVAYSPSLTWVPEFRLSEVKLSDAGKELGKTETSTKKTEYLGFDQELIVRVGYQF